VITSLAVVDHGTISGFMIVGTMTDDVSFQWRPIATCQSPARLKMFVDFLLFYPVSPSFTKVKLMLIFQASLYSPSP
jgi:hypothetical protein